MTTSTIATVASYATVDHMWTTGDIRFVVMFAIVLITMWAIGTILNRRSK